MSTTIVMPQLGESVAEGVIGKWLKAEGDQIAKDEPIVEVITDKVNAEIPSPVAGVLEKITQQEGDTVAVGQEIAIVGDGSGAGRQVEEPAAAAVGSPPGGSGSEGNTVVAPQPTRSEPAANLAASELANTAQAVASPPDSGNGRAERVRSSPVVRRLAEQYGVTLTEVRGTGIGGRVSKQDIMSVIEQKEKAPARAPTAAPPSAAVSPPAPLPLGPAEEMIPVSPVRKMIADRMVQSKTQLPHATTMVEVDMSKVVRYREAKKDEFRRTEGIPLSFVAFVIKATVEALKEYPLVNSEWAGDHIIQKRDININVAVDAPEGLTTPVIHQADEKSLAGISRAIYDLAERARSKKLKLEDMQGGTFTVNNTGALGSVWSISIINYPQCGILAAAAIVKRPVVIEQDGQDLIAVRSMMNASFSFDHRVLDGGYSAGFLSSVKEKLENWSMDYPLY